MIYIFTAMYAEARNIIDTYDLQNKTPNLKFPVYEGENIRLVITGIGSIAAAVAVTSVCTQYDVSENDFFVNIGIAASNDGTIGDIYLCNKIVEEGTGRTFYPDMIYRNSLKEIMVTTCIKPKDKESLNKNERTLFDMEAAAIYQAGSYYIGPHQMSFLKVISDLNNPAKVTKETIEEIMKQSEIIDYIDSLIKYNEGANHLALPDAEMEKWKTDFKASVVMENTLEQLIVYCSLAKIDYKKAMNSLYVEGKLPCKSKREGKIYLEELRKQLL